MSGNRVIMCPFHVAPFCRDGLCRRFARAAEGAAEQVENPGEEGPRIGQLEEGVRDPPSGADHPQRRTELSSAELPPEVASVRVLPSVADTRPGRDASRLSAEQPIAPDRREWRPRFGDQLERSEWSRVEVDGEEPPVALHELHLEDPLPAHSR